jgi:hypothetical protein
MRNSLIAAITLSPLFLSGLTALAATPTPGVERISGPVSHENLTVYFIHGPSTPGKVPLTLDEALAKRVVQVRETGNVNQLELENLGLDEVFIQSGDIVKGGQQDRTLMVSLILPAKSGRVPIASFCVEQGRWSARGREDVKSFSTASASVPSREMKLAMKVPQPVAVPELRGRGPALASAAAETSARQGAVWEGVKKMQDKLSRNVGSPVSAAQSTSSLQLALENEKVVAQQNSYVAALRAAGEADSDIVGYAFAVNGKLNSADVYPSNGLFRKMWTKLLNASATEALGHKDESRDAAPSIDAVMAFLGDAEKGKGSEKPLNVGVKLDTREGEKAFFFETARASASPSAPKAWVHRNYLAK